ncbi:related to dihydrodipicolinate synthetase family protein [Cephalotrichum gorgonifer]|uniref:Related to dihydrodipicolinate synthetase family protein n=1 Tax=Cephalotrichum gorgonifer TaxID=2041049 RepID=A0AAE8N5V9_9PEZI|nr:related to dihydrodipicolinate synthetase family protein [Cephalotrichum gorgonifer]
MARTLLPGIYAPTQVFFDPITENLDSVTIAQHAVRLAKAGVAGIVTNGSNGEAVFLSSEERAEVTKITREALDAAGFTRTSLLVGASDESVRGTLKLCREAAEAGGDAVLLMTPSFFKWAMDTATIERFFTKVADESPIPVVIYNYPGAVSGIDIDSEALVRLAQHPNIVGTKFTCGNVGKLARVAGETKSVSELFPTRTDTENPYFAFAGIADFISSSVVVGGSGAIVGAANVFPRACVRVYNLAVAGKIEEAVAAQQDLAKADWSLTKRAIPGFKAILDRYHGYGGSPREPIQALSNEAAKDLCAEIQWMMGIENDLKDVV